MNGGVGPVAMADLDSITFDDNGWKPVRDESRLREWHNDFGDRRVYEIDPHPEPPPFDPRDVGAFRSFERERAAGAGGAIVEADILSRPDLLVHRLVTKVLRKPSGMVFTASVAFTLGGAAFSIRHECPGGPSADERERGVADELGMAPRGSGVVGRLLGRKDAWFGDPYDPSYRAPFLRSRADDEAWDDRYPESPLSRARRHLRNLLESLEVAG